MPIIADCTSRVNNTRRTTCQVLERVSHVRISHSVLSAGTSGETVCQTTLNPGMAYLLWSRVYPPVLEHGILIILYPQKVSEESAAPYLNSLVSDVGEASIKDLLAAENICSPKEQREYVSMLINTNPPLTSYLEYRLYDNAIRYRTLPRLV